MNKLLNNNNLLKSYVLKIVELMLLKSEKSHIEMKIFQKFGIKNAIESLKI